MSEDVEDIMVEDRLAFLMPVNKVKSLIDNMKLSFDKVSKLL